jgi:fructose-bisphosphate aldolase class 1
MSATTTLKDTALALIAPDKGILAADESHATTGRRFEALGISTARRTIGARLVTRQTSAEPAKATGAE